MDKADRETLAAMREQLKTLFAQNTEIKTLLKENGASISKICALEFRVESNSSSTKEIHARVCVLEKAYWKIYGITIGVSMTVSIIFTIASKFIG